MNSLELYLRHHLICLNCGEFVKYYPVTKADGYFLCNFCHNVHLRINKVSIFVPTNYEDKLTFGNFFLKHFSKINHKHRTFFVKKGGAISKNRNLNWEDNDIKFWDEKYRGTLKSVVEKLNYLENPRDIARKKYLFDFLPKKQLKDKIICEIGTGEARTTMSVLPVNRYKYNYIATDYSFQSLAYLRSVFGNNPRVCFIQCLGEKLPFNKRSLDYLISLGVLHHMPKKEGHIKQLSTFIKSGGLLLLDEPYRRESRLSDFLFKHTKIIFEPKASAHEERLNKQKLLRELKNSGKIVSIHHLCSPIMTIYLFLMAKLPILGNSTIIKFVFFLDNTTITLFGKIFPFLGSGQCEAVVKMLTK